MIRVKLRAHLITRRGGWMVGVRGFRRPQNYVSKKVWVCGCNRENEKEKRFNVLLSVELTNPQKEFNS